MIQLFDGDDQRLIQQATAFLANQFSSIPKVFKGIGLMAIAKSSSLRDLFETYAQGLHVTLPAAVYATLEAMQ